MLQRKPTWAEFNDLARQVDELHAKLEEYERQQSYFVHVALSVPNKAERWDRALTHLLCDLKTAEMLWHP